MNTNYTPKPWTAGPLRDYQVTSDGEGATPFECIDIESPTGSICMAATDQVGQVEAIANADLISAAPDLLEALIHLTEKEWFKDPTFTGKHVICGLDSDKVRNAILKATGAVRP